MNRLKKKILTVSFIAVGLFAISSTSYAAVSEDYYNDPAYQACVKEVVQAREKALSRYNEITNSVYDQLSDEVKGEYEKFASCVTDNFASLAKSLAGQINSFKLPSMGDVLGGVQAFAGAKLNQACQQINAKVNSSVGKQITNLTKEVGIINNKSKNSANFITERLK